MVTSKPAFQGEFNPMKVELFPKSESECSSTGEEESKENMNKAQSSSPRRKKIFGRRPRKLVRCDDSVGAEETLATPGQEESVTMIDRAIGPWGSVSQVTTRGTQASQVKKVAQSAGKQAMESRRNRRMPPDLARKTAEAEKERVQMCLNGADQLWKRLECPAKGDPYLILGEYSQDCIRYAQQGKRCVRLAKLQGAIKAKTESVTSGKPRVTPKEQIAEKKWKIQASKMLRRSTARK